MIEEKYIITVERDHRGELMLGVGKLKEDAPGGMKIINVLTGRDAVKIYEILTNPSI